MPDRLQMYNMLHRLGPASVFTPEFRTGVDTGLPLEHQRETWQASHAGALINRMLAWDWKYTLADNDLPKVVDTADLAGVDVGFPLLSDELFDFSLGLPPEWKLKGLSLRWFFKEALRGFLPDEIIRPDLRRLGLPAPRPAGAGARHPRPPQATRHRPPGLHRRTARLPSARPPGLLRRHGMNSDDDGALASATRRKRLGQGNSDERMAAAQRRYRGSRRS